MSGSDLLERYFDHFDAPRGSVSDCADRLRKLGIRMCSFENLTTDQGKPMTLSGMTLEEILDAIVERNPGYCWDEPRVGLINLFPEDSVLDSPVPAVVVRSKGCRRVLEDNLQISRLGIFLFEEFGDPDGPVIDLDLEHADLRTALNAIVSQLEPLVWHVAGRPGAYYLSFTNVPMALSSKETSPLSCRI